MADCRSFAADICARAASSICAVSYSSPGFSSEVVNVFVVNAAGTSSGSGTTPGGGGAAVVGTPGGGGGAVVVGTAWFKSRCDSSCTPAARLKQHNLRPS